MVSAIALLTLTPVGLAQEVAVTDIPIPEDANLLLLPTTTAATRALAQPCDFLWQDQPLRQGLNSLEQSFGISIWLDRRIDPSQLVSFSTRNAEIPSLRGDLRERLSQIASRVEAAAGQIENVVYIGPKDQVAQSQRSAVLLHASLVVRQPELAGKSRELQWPELCSAEELLRIVGDTWNLEIQGTVPHDLLHGGSLLSPTTAATQLSIASAGFASSGELANGRIQLTPLRDQSDWVGFYSAERVDATRLRDENLRELQSQFPSGRVTKPKPSRRGDRPFLLIGGPTEFHLALLAPVTKSRRNANDTNQVYSFEITNLPVEPVLKQLARDIGFELQWSEACGEAQKSQLISLKIHQARTSELIQQVAKAAGLHAKYQDGVAVIDCE